MRRIFIFTLQVICTLTITAQTTGKARLQAFAFSETTYINKLSDNGLWAVASNVDANDATLYNYPYLLDITKGTSISLLSEAEKLSSPDCCANDITDDGKIVVGGQGYYRNTLPSLNPCIHLVGKPIPGKVCR